MEGTRSLFYVCALLTLGLTALSCLPGATAGSLLLLVLATTAMAVSWTCRQRLHRVPLVLDAVDGVATLLFALTCTQPAVALAVTFAAQWSRAVYGSRGWRILAYSAGLGLGVIGAVLAWELVPWHAGPTPAAPVLGALPVLAVDAIVTRHLALVLFARDESQRRDAALADLGTRLLGVTDREAIYASAWAASSEVCRSTPGMGVLTVQDDGTALVVRGSTDGLPGLPGALPRASLAGARPDGHTYAPPAELVTAAGRSLHWYRLPVPEIDGGWMLIGMPSASPEVVTLFRALMNQVALALRNADAHRDLAEQARTDPLTGLANRTAFTAALAAEQTPGTWVLFVDLDDFKVVNDGLGHRAGDRLLQAVAERLRNAVREGDIVARLGGDEFAVLLGDATGETAAATGRRLVELISVPVVLDGRSVRVGASVGLAAHGPGTAEIDVVQRADIAMYAAKTAGKNRVQAFCPSLVSSGEALALEADLRTAVDGNQFVVVYQPIVAARDGRCTAVEALVRWAHPTRGLLAPAQFLDLAERTGLIVPLGEQVLRQACADARAWRDAGCPVAVHVNASPLQLAHPHFVSLVRECLLEHGLPPEQLVVEITESSALDSPAARTAIDALAAMAVGIAVDDFGTGYSALTLLRTAPIDIVKIDKSFVAGAATEAADQAVLHAIVTLAGSLGMQTVAEGVEDVDQQRFVELAGITGVQGYLHLRPVPAEVLTAWLHERARRPAVAASNPGGGLTGAPCNHPAATV